MTWHFWWIVRAVAHCTRKAAVALTWAALSHESTAWREWHRRSAGAAAFFAGNTGLPDSQSQPAPRQQWSRKWKAQSGPDIHA